MPPLPPSHFTNKKGQIAFTICPSMLALPIFPARLQASIFGRSELNFRVRNGNGWTLALISTNFVVAKSAQLRFRLRRKLRSLPCSSVPSQTRFAGLFLGSETTYVIRYDRRTNRIIPLSFSLVKTFRPSAHLPAHRGPSALVHLHGLEPGTH